VTGYPELLGRHRTFTLASPRAPEAGREYRVERIRLHSNVALIKLAGCDDRNTAETLRDMLVSIPVENAVPLDDGEFYHHQIVGLRVETIEGEGLGKVAEVLETGADDVYVVKGPLGEILLPAISEVVRDIDLDEGKMSVRLLPGLLREDQQ
jgi:16S rRNA processing protein RimM